MVILKLLDCLKEEISAKSRCERQYKSIKQNTKVTVGLVVGYKKRLCQHSQLKITVATADKISNCSLDLG